MSSKTETLLCRYHYDPLDRLTDCTPPAQARTQRFYLKNRLTSEIQGSLKRSIFQQDDQLLAQQQRQDVAVETTLLATDQQRSVLHALDATRPHPLAYTPYGHRAPESGLLSLLGFNGERPDPVTGHYLLGNGYRAFNPVLMRFNSPDSMSPFEKGGLNAYTYCLGDPINRVDPTGHIWKWLVKLVMPSIPRRGSFTHLSPKRQPAGNIFFESNLHISTGANAADSHSSIYLSSSASDKTSQGDIHNWVNTTHPSDPATSADFHKWINNTRNVPEETHKNRIDNWLSEITNTPDKELKKFTKLSHTDPRPLADPFHARVYTGESFGRHLQEKAHQYAKGKEIKRDLERGRANSVARFMNYVRNR